MEESIRKLPIKEIAVSAITHVVRNFSSLVRGVGWVIVALTLLDFLPYLWSVSVTASYMIFAFEWALFCILAVSCHRFFLLYDRETVRPHQWSRRETRFLVYVVLVYLIFTVFSAMAGVLAAPFLGAFGEAGYLWSVVIILLAAIPAGIIFSALSLIFPSIAIGQDTKLMEAWDMGKGNSFRLLFLVVVFPYLFEMPFVFLPYLLGDSWVVHLLILLVSNFLTILAVAALSFSYAYLVSGKPMNKEQDMRHESSL